MSTFLSPSASTAIGVAVLFVTVGSGAAGPGPVKGDEPTGVGVAAAPHRGLEAPQATTTTGRRAEAPKLSSEIRAVVLHADGSPAPGAIVVTSVGGQGVTDAEGVARFTINVDAPTDSLHVTAVASINGVNYAGASAVTNPAHHGVTDAGVITLSAGADCEPAWIPTFGSVPGMNAEIFALTVFDDGAGAGPALYAGGEFTTAGGVTAHKIAKWDGAFWTPLGAELNGQVLTMTIFDDGAGGGPALYAGGAFTAAGDVTLNRIGKWDGAAWSPLGVGTSGIVFALAVYDDGAGAGPALYAGGLFLSAGGMVVNRIAKWNGAAWSTLGGGMTAGFVHALQVFDDGAGGGPALYAAGGFSGAGTTSALRIAKWNGSTWSALGVGLDGDVNALAVFDDGAGPSLYAGGFFTTAGGVSALRIAKWNGVSWSPLAGGLDNWVSTLAVYDDGAGAGPALYAGGGFTSAGAATANHIAKWNGSFWSSLGNGADNWVEAMAVYDDGAGGGPAIYIGGFFTTAGGVTVNRIASWNGASWSAVGRQLNDWVSALTVFDDGAGPALYAGGAFTVAGGVTVNNIAKWDGASWSSLGSGMGSDFSVVSALTVYDDGAGGGPALYAGGEFVTAGGVTVNNIAKWNGVSWSSLGGGVGGDFPYVSALAVFDDGAGPALYAGGEFTTAGGATVSNIAKWNGATWSPLGLGVSSWVWTLAAFDDGAGPALFAGGGFINAGGITSNYIAKWNGAAWSPLGTGMTSVVLALRVFDDGAGPALYVGGEFTDAGDVTVNHIAKWNGALWSPLGAGLDNAVYALTVFDDGAGAGPALYVGGDFTTDGSATLNNIAKWDGAAWTSLGSGMNSAIIALTGFDSGAGPALIAGGFFTASPAGDTYLARWQGCPARILGDLNGDGRVNAQDLGILLGSWGLCPPEPEKCPADINADGRVNAQDLSNLLGNWGAH